MRIPTIEKFLCCIKLELAALIIGWIRLLWSFVSLVFLSVLLGWAIVSYASLLDNLPSDSDISDLIRSYPPILVKFMILMFIVYFGISFYASKRLVDCLKTRKPSDTIPYMSLLIFDFIFSILTIFHLTWIALVQGLIRTICYGYIFISIYSLKELLTEEARQSRHRTTQYQTAPLTMYKF